MYTPASLRALAGALLLAPAALAQTDEPAMMRPLETDDATWFSLPLFTIGEAVDGYQPPGIPDGIGAWAVDRSTVRFYVNHELSDDAGFPYALNDGGLLLTGARISAFDVDRPSLQVVGAGPAYDRVADRAGARVTSATQVNEGTSPTDGFDRFCSAAFFDAGQYGLVDDFFITGEETGDGQAYVLDPLTGILRAVPALGRAAFESVTFVDSGDDGTVAALIGDDRAGAPLYLYVGQKNAGPASGVTAFLDRNGLASGALYVWVADDGSLSPEDFNGTGEARTGSFQEIDYFDPALAGTPGYDAQGYATMARQDELSAAVGAFRFSRPEDLATNPADGHQIVFASTGRGDTFPSDDWGTTYVLDVDAAARTATATILYDGDDAGAGQFAHPDEGLRSPDNLVWGLDGQIYVQEDRSTGAFGQTSGEEASVWAIDPETGVLTRIAQMDRSAVPSGQTDAAPGDLGNWESSGVIDVTRLFGLPAPLSLLMLDVQAHSVGGGPIAEDNLVQGGQLLFLLGVRGTGPLAQALTEALTGARPGSLADALSLATATTAHAGGAATFGIAGVGPNPLAAEARVRFATTTAGPVRLAVYDALGREVAVLAEGTLPAGAHQARLDGAALPAGVYVVRLSSTEGSETVRVTVAR